MGSIRLRLVLALILTAEFFLAISLYNSQNNYSLGVQEELDQGLLEQGRIMLSWASPIAAASGHPDKMTAIPCLKDVWICRVWIKRQLVSQEGGGKGFLLPSHSGLMTVSWQGQNYRILTLFHSSDEVNLLIGKPLPNRLPDSFVLLMWEFGRDVLLMTPLILVLIWLLVSTSLNPLKHIRRELAARTPDQLEPIQCQDVPQEILPLIETINELFERVRSSLAIEKQFTADAAHELRTPLAALKTQTQVALRVDNEAEKRAVLLNILQGVERTSRIVNQLLTLARVDPLHQLDPKKLVSLKGVISVVLHDFEGEMERNNLQLIVDAAEDYRVMGYEEQLFILIRNLVENAINYTPKGGCVEVELKQTDSGRVLLGVEDSGLGVPPEERVKILNRFYRVLGHQTGGSGLGLSIVKTIADHHQAMIEMSQGKRYGGFRIEVIF
ncbi:MAG: hypothetical protein G3I11_00630 [Ferrovum sp.]|nr:hypothetical protein [Ferrovum sp.]